MTSEQILQPITSKERINSLDIIRGIALFGILLMNTVGFGLFKAYLDPTNSGGATGWDLKVWWINNMFLRSYLTNTSYDSWDTNHGVDHIATTAFKNFSNASVELQLSDIPQSATINVENKEGIRSYVEKLKKYGFYVQYVMKVG